MMTTNLDQRRLKWNVVKCFGSTTLRVLGLEICDRTTSSLKSSILNSYNPNCKEKHYSSSALQSRMIFPPVLFQARCRSEMYLRLMFCCQRRPNPTAEQMKIEIRQTSCLEGQSHSCFLIGLSRTFQD